eukprot:11692194-Heterocapsa_arctica.AAC.1
MVVVFKGLKEKLVEMRHCQPPMSLPTALLWTRWGRPEGPVGARVKAGGGFYMRLCCPRRPRSIRSWTRWKAADG